MDTNDTISITLEEQCKNEAGCLFVAGDGLFKVWHVILIAAAIVILIRKY